MLYKLPYGLTLTIDDLWTSESELKSSWYSAIRKNEQKVKGFVLRLNGKFAYSNEKLDLTPDINNQALSLYKKWEEDSLRQIKWGNRISLIATHWSNVQLWMRNLSSIEFDEEKDRLRKYIPEIILNNQEFLPDLLKSINTLDVKNCSWFKPVRARSAVIFYLADINKISVESAFMQYKYSSFPGKGEYEEVSKEHKSIYEKLHDLDALRYHAEVIKCTNAKYLNYLTESLSWSDIYKCPIASVFGENTRMRKKISLILQIRVENWISNLMKNMEILFRRARWGNRKNTILKLAVNDSIKTYPKDEEGKMVHYTICGENLSENFPMLYIIEQSAWHQDLWFESTEYTGEIVNVMSDPVYLPIVCVNLGHGIQAKIYEIDDMLLDGGW